MKTHTSPVEWRMPSAIAARLPRLCENWMHTRLGWRLRAASISSQVSSEEPSSTATTSSRPSGYSAA